MEKGFTRGREVEQCATCPSVQRRWALKVEGKQRAAAGLPGVRVTYGQGGSWLCSLSQGWRVACCDPCGSPLLLSFLLTFSEVGEDTTSLPSLTGSLHTMVATLWLSRLQA